MIVAVFPRAAVAAGEVVSYRVSGGGQDLGYYRFTLEPRPDGGREVTAEMAIQYKLLFVTVYRATHQRRETWIRDRLETCAGRALYNGTNYGFELARLEGGCRLTANGSAQELAGTIVTFVPWRLAFAGPATMLTEKGRLEPVTFTAAGREKIRIAGQEVEAEKCLLSGRKPRELWYDQRGNLLRARYEHGETMIVLTRERLP